jgi:ATP-dependent RNA helicase RhlE
VINYDVPHSPEDYVHRIGRTGRVEAVGDAFTLMSPEEKQEVAAIERFLGRSIPRVVIPDFDYKRQSDGAGRGAAPGGRRHDGPSRRDGPRRERGGSASTGPRPAAPQGPEHGRRPRRGAPDRRRRRM